MAANSQWDKIEENIQLIHPECAKGSAQAQLSSSIVDEKSSNKVIKKDQKYFLFDIIVVRLDIPNMTVDQTTKLLINVNFNGKKFKISSNRINVLDFTTESSLEFAANPTELKQQLPNNPLTLKVADSKKVLGYGTLKWPTEFLSDLEQCAGEITDSFEIELMKCDGTRTGSMHIVVRLLPKCEEYEEYDTECRNANKEIDPNDVLFVVGEEARKNCCCSQIGIIPASDSDHELHPKCLDLTNYRAINSQNTNNTNILASQDPACQKVQAIENHYQKLLEALKSKNYQNTPMNKPTDKKCDLFYTVPSDTCLNVNVSPSSSNFHPMPLAYAADDKAFAAKNVKQIAHKVSAPELVENEPQSFRYCPLCKENMEYLPKLAACPNCCYKPFPHFEEKPYDDSQNADQILHEFHEKLQKSDNTVADSNTKDSPKCRCTCKYGSNKPCAYCRIRKLCEDIFQPPLSTTNSNSICEPKSSVINCVSSNDNRPFLTKIFSELKDIYDIEEPKRKELELDEHCEKRLNKNSVNRKYQVEEKNRNVETIEMEDPKGTIKPQEVKKRKKRSAKNASKKTVNSKLYDYQFTRQKLTYKCGHKTCTNSIPGYKNVPPNMGWLWNIQNSRKWKPGTIQKPIQELMKYFLKDFPADTLLVSPYSYRSKSKRINNPSHNTLVQKPTLHVFKKNGEYIITMRPLKPPEFLKESADPYENMKPIQFRIVKNPQLNITRDLKTCLKSMGFKKCTCHRPITYCYCRSFVDKKRLEYQCGKECSKLQIECCCDTLILSDTSESEDEFDFGVTPPVGVIKPEKLKTINLVNVATQYNELDWNPVPLFPRPPNKYMQMYQCAVKEREAKPILAGKDKVSDVNHTHSALRKDSCPQKAFRFSKGFKNAGKGHIVGRDFGIAKGGGGGDGLMMGGRIAKGRAAPIDLSGKSGGHGDPASNQVLKKLDNAPKKKVDMLKYVLKSQKKMSKLTPEEVSLKRREKINLLKGTSPPLLCTIDRRGKPIDPYVPCFPCNDDRIC